MQSTSDYLLHKSLDRPKIYQSNDGIWWSTELKKWMCSNPELIKKIIDNPEFRVHNYEPKNLGEKLKLNFQHLIKIVSYFPIALEDEEHKAARKKYALKISSKYDESLICFKNALSSKLHKINSPHTAIDLVQNVIEPSLKSALMLLSGLDILKDCQLGSISQILDEKLSINRRIELNHQIAIILEGLPSNIDIDEKYFMIAVFALGYDSLLGSITSSVAMTLLENNSKRINEINWSKDIPYTGVPVIERVAKKDCQIGHTIIKSGEKVKLYIESAGFINGDKSMYSSLFFGHGIHKCVGMHFSNAIWKILINEFSKLNKLFTIKSINTRPNDYVFNVFSNITVDLYD